MYLGRYAQGSEIPLTIHTGTAAGAPEWPAAAPFVEVWKDGSPLVRLVADRMAAYQPGVRAGVFRLGILLGALFSAAGRYFVVVRWTDSNGIPVQVAGSFELLAGGSARGTVTSMTEVVRPDARYLLTATDAGVILRRKNPR